MIMGPAFIVMGYFNKIGMLPTRENSHDNPAVIFPIVGIAFSKMLIHIILICN